MSDFVEDFLKSWVEDDTILQTLYELAKGTQVDPAVARDCNHRLYAYEGPRLIKKYIGNHNYEHYYPTDRVGPAWENGQPTGVVDHYTAGVSVRGPLLWFSSRERAEGIPSSSAHVVISPDGEAIFLVNPLARVAWHARGANHTAIGIEHVNAGLLRENDNGELFYQVNRPYVVRKEQPPIEMYGDSWEPYMRAQALANVLLKRMFLLAQPSLRPERFVDHQMIEPERKHDCGPLWPLPTLNEIVVKWWDVREIAALDPGNGVLDTSGLSKLSEAALERREAEMLGHATPRALL